MKDALLCLNSEWQGCESPILEKGSTRLARELFGSYPYTDLRVSTSQNLEEKNGVFALDLIGSQFIKALKLLQEKSPQRVMTVGGTCGTEAAPVSYLNSLYENDLALVWFDAHGDLNTTKSSPSGHFHGMVLRTLLGEGPNIFCDEIKKPLRSKQIFLSGVRDLDKEEQEYIESSNISVCEVNEILSKQIIDSGFSKVYIHIDVDAINPDDFSDALMPTTGGPTRQQISKCLSAINEQLDIVGVGIVEYSGKHKDSSIQILQMISEAGITIQ